MAAWALPGLAASATSHAPRPAAVDQDEGVYVDPAALADVLAILGRLPFEHEPDSDRMAAELGKLGPRAIGPVLALLAGEIEDLDPSTIGLRRKVLRASLRAFESRALVDALLQRAGPGSSVGSKMFAVDHLGRIDDIAAVEALLEVVGGLDADTVAMASTAVTVQRALGSQLALDPGNWKRLDVFAVRCDRALLPLLARAAGSTGTSQGLGLLSGWIGRDAGLDGVLLREIGRYATRVETSLPESALGKVRTLLIRDDLELRCGAASVLGQVRDRASFEILVGLLEVDEHVLTSTVRWSLERIAGRDLGPEAEAWIRWETDEATWWRDEAPALLEHLGDRDSGHVRTTLRALTLHPYYRHDITDAVGQLVVHPDPEVVRASCAALVELQSSRAVTHLVVGLGGSSEATRKLCGEALVELTGLDLPAEQRAWMVAVNR